MIQSMTGYAVGDREAGAATLHLELKSVNSRFLDVAFRCADDLRFLEMPMREQITGRVQRGKVECRLNLLPRAAGPRESAPNLALMEQLARLDYSVRQALPVAAPLSVADVLRWPGVLGDQALDLAQVQAEGALLLVTVLGEFVASREREGGKLAQMIRERVSRMGELVAGVTPLVPKAIADYEQRLAAKLREAAAGLDEDRIRQEIGLFAARIDVAEEISRLTAHLDEVARVLGKGGAVGKRLDFLMQELNREANTLSAKSVSAEVTGVALELKLLIEQMREQVQNLE